MKLCLDSLTLNDTEPVDIIRCASKAGFDWVSLWVQPPAMFAKPLVTPAKTQDCIRALADTGVQLGPLEVFDLDGLKVGVGVCFDGGFPEFPRVLALLGAVRLEARSVAVVEQP